MIKLIDSLVVSNTILNILINDSRFTELDGYIELFENCREQGYKLVLYKNIATLTICFSQDRNSDNIVVYFSNQYERNPYSDIFWNNAKYFNYDQYHAAIYYIYEVANDKKITT